MQKRNGWPRASLKLCLFSLVGWIYLRKLELTSVRNLTKVGGLERLRLNVCCKRAVDWRRLKKRRRSRSLGDVQYPRQTRFQSVAEFTAEEMEMGSRWTVILGCIIIRRTEYRVQQGFLVAKDDFTFTLSDRVASSRSCLSWVVHHGQSRSSAVVVLPRLRLQYSMPRKTESAAAKRGRVLGSIDIWDGICMCASAHCTLHAIARGPYRDCVTNIEYVAFGYAVECHCRASYSCRQADSSRAFFGPFSVVRHRPGRLILQPARGDIPIRYPLIDKGSSRTPEISKPCGLMVDISI
ncbi:hypothetical protein BDY19DRAFT_64894 [Irpex rosettiformis]|uniref:Uncharacterized protein n=1 Tax=Irpex rosettiformis TaxID=378272 RepID=A0ACB8ULC9_9APHY|nr:hypothetical protein BDY19DRAFT_64894 [Irpex rosettiformis]